MKRTLSYIVLFLFTGIYFISDMNPLMRKISPIRYEWKSLLGTDNYTYGDLYGLSYLKDFKKSSQVEKTPTQNSAFKNIDFYCICDSYIWSFPMKDSTLFGVNKYYQSRWTYDETIKAKLDSSKINFLMIEMSERNVRYFLSDSSDIYSRMVINKSNENYSVINRNNYGELINKFIANPKLNKNLEFNLFDYRFITPIRELKANLIYKFFNRVNSDVVISTDKKYLFYKPTIDTLTKESSFKFICNEEVNKLVLNLNFIQKYFLTQGFKHVYFSIVPNPVSILEPNMLNYNNLVEKIQTNSNLNVPFIDAYNFLSKDPQTVFRTSDSHWNSHGFNLWLDELNTLLKNISSKGQ